MEYLGGVNLLTYHFTIGCKESSLIYTKTITNHIESLHKWIDFKNNDWGMKQYNTDNTQYICYLEIIPIEILKEIIKDLYTIYKKKYPYSEYSNFIEYTFDYTLYDLKRIIERDYHWLSESPNENIFTYYNNYLINDREYIDFGLNTDLDIEYFKQYYKLVIELLSNPVDGLIKTIKSTPLKPFRDNETKDFFDFIILNWERKTANRWGYFWEFIVTKNNGKLTSKVDFENYLISQNLYSGKPNYESCNSNRIFIELEELFSEFKIN